MTQTTSGIVDKVRGVAAEKRFTQQRIALTLGIARSSVAERFAGRVSFTADEVYKLAVAMDVPVARFFPEPDRNGRAA
jgi:transcriptional regulator with XRE-family HTH domain